MSKQIIHINPNTYPVKFIVFLNYPDRTKKEIAENITGVSAYTKKHISKEIIESDLTQVDAMTYTCSTLSVIVVPIFKLEPCYFAVLQHELLHAVFHSGTKVGFKLSESSEEYYTYMLQFLTQKIYRAIDKVNK